MALTLRLPTDEATRRVHNLGEGNLDRATPGDWVNLEFDLLAKYVERMLPSRQRSK